MVGTRELLAARRALLVLFVVGLVVSPAATAAALTYEDPRFEVTVPEPTLTPGATQNLTVEVTNDAEDVEDRAETASAVEVAVAAGKTPVTVHSGPRLVGRMRDGDTRSVTVRVTVPEDVPAGAYRLPVHVTHEFEGDERERQTVYATVRVDPRARLQVADAASDVAVGERGSVTVTVENRGSRVARDVQLLLSSATPDIHFGQSERVTLHVGTLEPDARRTVTAAVTATGDADRQPYALSATATYEDYQGLSKTATLDSVGVTPAPELAIRFRNVSSSLRVDERGTFAGTVVNRGPRTAHDAVLVVETPSPLLSFTETRYPVGDLAPGEGRPVTFRVDVPASADAGQRLFRVALEYETADGDPGRTDAVQLRRHVAPDRDEVALEPVDATVRIDTSDSFAVRVTNVGDEPLTDLEAVLAPRPPFTSESAVAYVPRIAPGESARVAFELSVSEDAVPSQTAVAVNVSAEDPDGDAVRTGPHLVPVSVARREGLTTDLTILLGGAVFVVVVLGAGALWTRR